MTLFYLTLLFSYSLKHFWVNFVPCVLTGKQELVHPVCLQGWVGC